MIISFEAFITIISVVSVSKAVSIVTNYLLKLETFLIHFYFGKGTRIRSFEGGQLFPGKKKRKKFMVKCQEFIKNNIFCFLSRHQTESKRTESA